MIKKMSFSDKISYTLLDIILPPSAEMLAHRFLKHNDYPIEDKMFIGHSGDVYKIIGSDNYLANIRKFRDYSPEPK
jgi:hypothetical protein